MAEIKNFNLAGILSNAETIKSQRQANVAAEQQNRLNSILTPMRVQQAQLEQEQANQQQLMNESKVFLDVLGDTSGMDEAQAQNAWANARANHARLFGEEDAAQIPELFDPQSLQQMQGLVSAGIGGSTDTIQSTFLTDQGERIALYRSGRTASLGKSKMSPEEQLQFEKDKARNIRGGQAEVDLQTKPEIERRVVEAREQAQAAAAKKIAESGALNKLEDARAIYARMSAEDLDLIYGRGEEWYPGFLRSQRGIDLMADRDQLVSMLKLGARGELKGQGPITEGEQAILGQAVTALTNPNISPEAAERALNEAMNVFERAAGVTGSTSQSASPQPGQVKFLGFE